MSEVKEEPRVERRGALEFDAIDQAAEVYKALRAAGFVHRVSDLASFPGGELIAPKAAGTMADHAYLCVGRDECERVYRDTEHFVIPAAVREGGAAGLMAREWANDGEEHTRIRRLVSHAFRPRVLERWRAEFIEPLTHELIDKFIGNGRAELSNDFAMELPIQVISRIVGFPRENYAAFRKASIDLIEADPERGVKAREWVREQVYAVVDQRRENPGDDLISDLATVEINDERLTNEEVFNAVTLLLVGGNETTSRALGVVMYILMLHPEQFDLVRNDPSLVPAAVEEVLRWYPVASGGVRQVIKATDIGGAEVQPGELMMISKVSANRDERYYENGDAFSVTRVKPHPTLAFAAGPHFCIGIHLAKMELEIAVAALIDRLKNIRIESGAEIRLGGSNLGGVDHLPVLFDRA